MRYLIVGCGRVGSALAEKLDEDGHEVIVIDENPTAFKRLRKEFGGHVVVGTGIDSEVLRRAGAEKANAFVAVTNGDNRNIMAALIAQREFHIPKIVARIYDPQRGQLYRDLGVETVCPTSVNAQLIRDRLVEARNESMPELEFGVLTTLVAHVGSMQSGKRVGDFEEFERIRIAALHRHGRLLVVSSDTLLEIGDELHAVVASDAFEGFLKSFPDARKPQGVRP
ncbi:MAG TPA: TrkA family potassium uptake protein [Candidatus Dormibacteraeota bacterium]|nr:TrkA family potassium uptake protein [Candidatus Dormibacteraeota bacterium]